MQGSSPVGALAYDGEGRQEEEENSDLFRRSGGYYGQDGQDDGSRISAYGIGTCPPNGERSSTENVEGGLQEGLGSAEQIP